MDRYFKVLGIASNASEDEIKKAYQIKIKALHPDKVHGTPLENTATFLSAEINEAYDALIRHNKKEDIECECHQEQESVVNGENNSAPQWYEKDKNLYEFELKEMKKAFPKAELSVLKDDRLCWNITFNGILDANGNEHSWNFMMIYDSDHPHKRDYGGSIKVYPLNPSYDELVIMAKNAGRNFIPHILMDSFGNKLLGTAPREQVQVNNYHKIFSAVTAATWAASWATHFQMGLTDESVWNKFCEH